MSKKLLLLQPGHAHCSVPMTTGAHTSFAQNSISSHCHSDRSNKSDIGGGHTSRLPMSPPASTFVTEKPLEVWCNTQESTKKTTQKNHWNVAEHWYCGTVTILHQQIKHDMFTLFREAGQLWRSSMLTKPASSCGQQLQGLSRTQCHRGACSRSEPHAPLSLSALQADNTDWSVLDGLVLLPRWLHVRLHHPSSRECSSCASFNTPAVSRCGPNK